MVLEAIKLFGAGPAKARPGYANFAIADPPLKLILFQAPGKGGTINHLGVEVASASTVYTSHAPSGTSGASTHSLSWTAWQQRSDSVT